MILVHNIPAPFIIKYSSKKFIFHPLLKYTTLFITILCIHTTTLHAAQITVDSGCTLIDAIASANSDNATGSCSAGNGHDTIVLQNSSVHSLNEVNNGIEGANGLPSVTSKITIEGYGATIQRATNALKFRIFHISAGGELLLKNVTITGGQAWYHSDYSEYRFICGGGIANNGIAILDNSTVTDNNSGCGGGIYNRNSTATLTNSTISGNISADGGALYNISSVITLNNCTVTENRGQDTTGGMFNKDSTVSLNNTTISNNSSALEAGGFYNDNSTVTINNSTISGNSSGKNDGGNGGGFYNTNSIIKLNNSTISSNFTLFAGGGLFNCSNSSVTLNNCTVVENIAEGFFCDSDDNCSQQSSHGSGLSTCSDSTVTVLNSIIANEKYGGDCSRPVIDKGSNWFADNSCNGTGRGDPKLMALAKNGGPTKTHALSTASGAIDAGNDKYCAKAPIYNRDQRGKQRPNGKHCDIGAFEKIYTLPPAIVSPILKELLLR